MHDNKTARALAYIYTLIFFCVIAAQFAFAWREIEINEGIQRMLDITLGVLFAMVLASKDYFLGSSMGSARKTELIEKSSRQQPNDGRPEA